MSDTAIFDDFWNIYPHYKSRSKKALTRAIWEQITGDGRRTNVDGVRLSLRTTPERILAAAKKFQADIDRDYTASTSENRQYVPGSQVWLNQARWEDFEDGKEAALKLVS